MGDDGTTAVGDENGWLHGVGAGDAPYMSVAVAACGGVHSAESMANGSLMANSIGVKAIVAGGTDFGAKFFGANLPMFFFKKRQMQRHTLQQTKYTIIKHWNREYVRV